MDLVYFVIGFKPDMIEMTALAIRYFRIKNPFIKILVICDESFIDKCKSMFLTDVMLYPTPDSKNSSEATIKKLIVFDVIKNMDIKRVMYIDSDILVDRNIDSIMEKVSHPEKLYAYYENKNIESHSNSLNWSFKNYSDAYIDFFREKGIYVFNSGLFCFRNTPEMKTHFENAYNLIKEYQGEQFLEQSGMNVYFNKKNLVDGTLITNENYNMYYPFNESCRNKIIHFAGTPGNQEIKLNRMREFLIEFLFMKISCPKCSANIVVSTV